MKITTIRTRRTNEPAVKSWTLEAFLKRIQIDTSKLMIGEFRHELRPGQPERYRRYEEIPRVVATVELKKQNNGALGMKKYNGIVVLEVRGLMSAERCQRVKQAAMEMSSTLAAFVGATGQEVIILVKVSREDGSLPDTEVEAEAFYALAYRRMIHIYDATLPEKVTRMASPLRHTFLFPLDPHPVANFNAQPFPIRPSAGIADDLLADEHLLSMPEQRQADEMDLTAYLNYERAYGYVAEEVSSRLRKGRLSVNDYYKQYVMGMSTVLCKQGWPEEETVCHIWHHLKYKDYPGLTNHFVRTLVESIYDDSERKVDTKRVPVELQEPLMQRLIRRIESRYVFRFNTIMGYTEYRANHTWATPWMPVTEKVINTLTTDLQLGGLSIWNRDVRRYVNSARVLNFNPIDDFLFDLRGRWDGKDHIRALAATVPTPYPEQWSDWFHTWFLAMVAQWQGRDPRYGNSLVPLLISNQGMHKSAFCRQLLPAELRQWGYTDNLSLSEERPVHLAMSQMLLINLDEFNRISPQKQQGFLKNILQLPAVKVKRPYAAHTEEVPRLASFIATTNLADVLTDPSGSRRFIGIEVRGDIDMSQTPNYEQLYAQAIAELDNGARYWLNESETAAVMNHNRMFQRMDTSVQFFLDYFEPVSAEDESAKWFTVTELLLALKKQVGSAFKVPSSIVFGRSIRNIPNMVHRRTKFGEKYCVKPLFEV